LFQNKPRFINKAAMKIGGETISASFCGSIKI
jgi:hypothetical protein